MRVALAGAALAGVPPMKIARTCISGMRSLNKFGRAGA